MRAWSRARHSSARRAPAAVAQATSVERMTARNERAGLRTVTSKDFPYHGQKAMPKVTGRAIDRDQFPSLSAVGLISRLHRRGHQVRSRPGRASFPMAEKHLGERGRNRASRGAQNPSAASQTQEGDGRTVPAFLTMARADLGTVTLPEHTQSCHGNSPEETCFECLRM